MENLNENESRSSSATVLNNNADINLEGLQIKNANRYCIIYYIFCQFNSYSLRNKFGQFREFCKDNLDIVLVTKTKLGNSFPRVEFLIPGYCNPDMLDCISQGGEILLYI